MSVRRAVAIPPRATASRLEAVLRTGLALHQSSQPLEPTPVGMRVGGEGPQRWRIVAMRSSEVSSLGKRFHSIIILQREVRPGVFVSSSGDESRKDPLANLVRHYLQAKGFVLTGPRVDSFDFDSYTKLDAQFDQVWPEVQEIAELVASRFGAELSSEVNENGAHVHTFTRPQMVSA